MPLIARAAFAEELPQPPPEAPPAPPPAPAFGSDATAVRCRVNGGEQTLTVRADESALELVRERLGLTGAKSGCGHGACGACGVRVNGVTVAACLLPATALNGADVQTIEGLATKGAAGETLHPVQLAFMAEDGLQCGYCTPGFVLEGVGFYEKWRSDRGNDEPTRAEIAAAMSGHLCRCGSYDGIYRAMQGACAGRFEGTKPVSPRVEARDKVTGAAKYTVDIKLPGQLEGRILRSPTGSARVTRLDLDAALAMPGVRVVTPLAKGGAVVRYAGQEIVALAAVDADTADRALAAVVVEYEQLPCVVGMDAGRSPDSPVIYPTKADAKVAPSSSEGPTFPARIAGNVRGPTASHFFSQPGKAHLALDALRASGDGTLVEETWRTQTQCHTALEPHAAVASWDGPQRLTVYLSTQAVSSIAADLAERYHLTPGAVRVIANHVGGGFGAKATLSKEAVIAVDLAWTARAPVRVALDRAAELAVGGNRPAQEIAMSLGADADGALAGIIAHAYGDSGVAVGANCTVTARVMYPHKNKELLDYDVITNAAPAKPFRGPGGPPGMWALEQAVDEVAHRRKEEPIALRRRWDPNPVRQRLFGLVEALPLWKDRGPVGGGGGRFRRGVGLAASSWPYFLEPRSQVELTATPDGQILAASACQDMGNGSRSVVAGTIGRILGLDPSEITVRLGDSSDVWGPMSGGSRTTASIGAAAEHAAIQLRDALLEVAIHDLGLQGATAAPGGVQHSGGLMPWRELMSRTSQHKVIGKRRRDEGGYFLPMSIEGLKVGRALGGGLVVTEVLVDSLLGRVTVQKVWAGYGVGRIVVPALARSQCQGGILQGLSYAIHEERHLDPKNGALLSAGLEDYRIAGIAEMPEVDIHFDEEGFDFVQGGAIGLGELCTVGVAASIGNAVFHATGWRPLELPIRPDRVIAGVRV